MSDISWEEKQRVVFWKFKEGEDIKNSIKSLRSCFLELYLINDELLEWWSLTDVNGDDFTEYYLNNLNEMGDRCKRISDNIFSLISDVQNTPKNRPSESQQNQGVKSSDLDVQKGNVL